MAGTVNSWNNQIAGSYNQIILNAGTNGVAISTDASAATVSIATGGAVKLTTLGSTNSTSATTVQSGSGALAVTSTNGTLTVNSGTGALSVSNDASATTLAIGTGAAVKTVTLGSTNTTSITTIACGTGGCLVGASTNAHTTTVGSVTSTSTTNIQCGTGGANFGTSTNAHTTRVGSTTTTSTTIIQSGSGGIQLTAAAGANITVGIPIFDGTTGQFTNAAQIYSLVSQTGDQTNVTGDGTAYTVTFTNVIQDPAAAWTSPSTFTGFATGKYLFTVSLLLSGLLVTHTDAILEIVVAGTSAGRYRLAQLSPFAVSVAGGIYCIGGSCMVPMTGPTDTATVVLTVSGGTKVVGVNGSTTTGGGVITPLLSGYLAV